MGQCQSSGRKIGTGNSQNLDLGGFIGLMRIEFSL
jgi:hypothetical protein